MGFVWPEKRLDEVVHFQRGHDLTVANIEPGPYPVCGSNGVIGYHKEFTTEGPGLTLGRSGNSIGVVHYYDSQFWAHNTTLYSTAFHDSVPLYLFYALKTIDFATLNSGSAVPSLNRNHIHNIRLKVPSKDEQRALARVLSSLDNKIDLLHRQNRTLETMAETLFRQWFVEEANDDWEELRIGDVAELNCSTVNSSYEYVDILYLDTSSLSDGRFGAVQPLSIEEAPSRAKRLVKHNDVLISTVRPDQRHYGIVKLPVPNLVVSTGFCVITANGVDAHFLYLLLTSKEMTEFLHSIAEGSTSTYPSLKPSDLASLTFRKPPKAKHDEFASIANASWEKINYNSQQIATLEKLRDTLLPKLMSGEVRVQYE